MALAAQTVLYGDPPHPLQMLAPSLDTFALQFAFLGRPFPVGVASLAIVALAAIALAALLRRMRVPGAAIVAGVAIGVAMGPGVMGRVAPELTVRILDGNPAILNELVALRRERAAMQLALTAPSAAGVDASEARDELDARVAEADLAWQRERLIHRGPLHAAMIGLAALLLLASGGATSVRAPVRQHHLGWAILSAVWTVAISVPLMMLVLWRIGLPLAGAPALGAAAIACCGAWCVTREQRRVAHSAVAEGAALVEHANRWASAAACAFLVASLLVAEDARMIALAMVAIACLPIGWAVRPTLTALAERSILPALTALCMVTVEPYLDIAVGLTVVLYLLVENGRWVGMWLSHWSAGYTTALGGMRLALAGMSVEPMIVALVALGAATGAFPSWMVGSMLLAATTVALLTKARDGAAWRLAEMDRSPTAPE